MKKLVCLVFLLRCVVGLCAQDAVRMPVLRISCEMRGSFVKNMDYVNGSMELTDADGTVVSLPAKFKPRGATAQSYMMKPSLNMKLRTSDYSAEADSALLGMRSCSSWILDAMAIDRICMRNRVAFDLWNAYSRLPYDTDFGGRNGTEGRFVEVYINDKYYGIYCLSDRINRKLLNLKKVKENEDGSVLIRGVLYKSGTSDIGDQNSPGYNADSTACVISWHNAWELTYPEEYGGKAAWQPLLDAFAEGKSADYVRKYFFMENLVDYQILIMALSIGDNWGNKNHFLSIRNMQKDIDDPDPTESDRRRYVLTPWDLDTSLGGKYDGGYYDGNYSVWPVAEISKNALYPISSVMGEEEYTSQLKRRWMEVRRGALSVANVSKRLEGYRDLFLKSGAWQRMTDHYEAARSKPKYVLDLAHEISLIEQWYRERFAEMDQYFGIMDGIEEREAVSCQMPDAIYDMQGRRVADGQLKKGLYIRSGKKVLIQR